MPFPSIGGGNIEVILTDKIINCLYNLQERLTKVPPVMSKFR